MAETETLKYFEWFLDIRALYNPQHIYIKV